MCEINIFFGQQNLELNFILKVDFSAIILSFSYWVTVNLYIVVKAEVVIHKMKGQFSKKD